MQAIKCKRSIYFAISTIMLFLVLAIGPLDIFAHGYYYDEIVLQEDYLDIKTPIDLSYDDYIIHFTPLKKHFAGFVIMLNNQPFDNDGVLYLDIEDNHGNHLERISVSLNKVKDKVWYKTYSSANLKRGKEYILKFSIKNSHNIAPQIVALDTDYLCDEITDGNAAVICAYKESTFNLPTKVLLILIILSIWLYLTSIFIISKNTKRVLFCVSVLFLLTSVLSWNYMFNSMDNSNIQFDNFQMDSETLVTGPMYAELEGKNKLNEYGLGRYYNVLGAWYGNNLEPVNDTNWDKGYSKYEAAIIINSNLYTRSIINDLSKILFRNGDALEVTGTNDDGTYIVIKLEASKPLNSGKYGNIEDIIFMNSEGKKMSTSFVEIYSSQYGLQGKIFKWIARYTPMDIDQDIVIFNLACSIITAFVFVVITFLIAIKYNKIMASVFYITFWLSPWIVNFARNLYWVEFTWFIPMVIGLVYSIKITNRKWRVGCYISTLISIMIKCLCGYEYITSIMMGLIVFLLTDLVVTFTKRDVKMTFYLLRSILVLGISALIGFIIAICIHAQIKGNGDILEGINAIIHDIVLRRTSGADLNDWGADLWPSFNASIWDVYRMYFKFSTNVITGIPGNLFPLISCTPLVIFVYDYQRKKGLNITLISLYFMFYFTAVSWFIFAKSHSYVHSHMNYVMWYFGFVQICLYVCIDKLIEICRNINRR